MPSAAQRQPDKLGLQIWPWYCEESENRDRMSTSCQADRLQVLLLAKREYDDALAVVEQCESVGALTGTSAVCNK